MKKYCVMLEQCHEIFTLQFDSEEERAAYLADKDYLHVFEGQWVEWSDEDEEDEEGECLCHARNWHECACGNFEE